MKCQKIGLGTLFFLISITHILAADLMTEADLMFEQRSVQFDPQKMLADPTNINKSIELYQKIIDTTTDPELRQEAIWKILRDYYFKGLFVTHDVDERIGIYTTGVEIGEKYVEEFPESIAINCWFGVVLGYWGEVNSKIASARKGVPGKVKAIAEKVIKMDENYLDAAGYRMYGRLHYKVPKIPLVMGWPSKKKSIEYLEKACKIAPDNLFNKLYLAEVLLDQKQTERGVQLLNSIVNTNETVHGIASDAFLKQQAKFLLEKFATLTNLE